MAGKPIKARNIHTLIDLVRTQGSQSQAQMAQASGLQASTISNHTRVLRQANIFVYEGKGSTGPEGGRPSDLLSLNTELCATGVLHVRGRDILSTLLDAQGRILQRRTLSLPPGAEKDLPRIISAEVLQMRQQHPAYRATAVLVPTLVTPKGSVEASGDFPWSYTDLRSAVLAALPPNELFLLTSSATALAWHAHVNCGRRHELLLAFQIDKEPFALSAAILSEGSPLQGPGGRAGRLWKAADHTPYPFAGSPHTVRQFLAWVQDQLLSACCFLDSQCLVIGGEFLHLDPVLLEPFVQSLRSDAAPAELLLLRDRDAPLIGAAWMVAERYYAQLLESIAESERAAP